ncbi:MAG: hypothetical protein ABI654_06590 [Betaproteobacteria bacterium]
MNAHRQNVHKQDSFPRMPEYSSPGSSSYALGIVTAIVYVAGFAMIAAWFALLLLDEERAATAARTTASACNVCGVVDRVRELEPMPRPPMEGSHAEGAIVLLAVLGGAVKPGAPQARRFETSVVHDDGTVRVLRDYNAPRWKIGDRVKVIGGRVEPLPGGLENRQSQVADRQSALAAR